MIDCYWWATPNGHKVTIFLEEAGLPYALHPVDIGRGQQFAPEFLKVAPNNRIPAIVDHEPPGGGPPLALFESGAILEYLADRTGRFLPAAPDPARYTALQWLYWQMGGLGPMLGQNHHFSQYAPEKIPYAIERYRKETERLYGVLERRLAEAGYLGGAYGIADMAAYPWTVPHERQGIDLAGFPAVRQWFDAIAARPAVARAYARAGEAPREGMDEAAKAVLFGQGRRA